MNNFFFKDRDGKTPLSEELRKGLIPKNIQTVGELDEYEEQNIAEGLIWLEGTNQKCLDYIFWCKLHKKLLKDVWEWAGKIRKNDLNNPDFLLPANIRTELMKLIRNLEYWFEHKSYPEKDIIARLHERLLTIHPFANGNGRWSRILTEYICKKNQIQIPTWNVKLKDDPKKRRQEYIDAIEEARRKKNFKLLIKQIFN
ncbi:mobile mystery protein B [bacterium]|nr:mobile mystery protein B [bacterium]